MRKNSSPVRLIAEGSRFGRWTTASPVESIRLWNRTKLRVLCMCDCGTSRHIDAWSLAKGDSKSCRCAQVDERRTRFAREGRVSLPDGDRSHSLANTWKGMMLRCYSPSNPSFPDYGGRGIGVCDRWRASFVAFCSDIGERPSKRHSIDRIDNSGNYEPGNCRWATQSQQCRNTRRNRFLTIRGETLCIAEWAERAGVPYVLVYDRLRSGRSPEDAVFGKKPLHPRIEQV